MNLIAKGNTAEVFDYSSGMVCKLFYEGYPVESVKVEYQNAKLLYELELPVPRCYEQKYINNRHGLIYEKIEGTDLKNYLMDEAKYSMVVSTLANTHKEMLKHECKLLPTYKDFIRRTIKDKDIKLISYLNGLPDGNTLCHGDFHPGNIMLESNGGIKVIDFMNLCRGPREYDIARTYYLIGYSKLPKEMSNSEDFQALREIFAKDYIDEMGVDLRVITPYLHVIEKCHNIELEH